MKKFLIIILLLSLSLKAQTKAIDFKNKEWFLKIDETEIFTQDTLKLIYFKKLNSSKPKLHNAFAQLCYNNNQNITNVNFSRGNFSFSRSTFELCGILGDSGNWKYFYDVEEKKVSIESENRRYIFKIIDEKLTNESWNCESKENDLTYSAEIETVTLVKIK